jgi:signal transduction histidine kinase/CheY-like chemotaxis protein
MGTPLQKRMQETVKQQNLRTKLIVFVVFFLSGSTCVFCSLAILQSLEGSHRWFNLVKTRIETDLHGKGMTLVVNNGMALRTMAEDNAVAAIRDIVIATVQNDSDIAYGIYMDNDCRPWVLALPKNKTAVVTGAAPFNDQISLWAHRLDTPGYREIPSEKGAPSIIEFAAPVFSTLSARLGVIRYGISTARMYTTIITEKRNASREITRNILYSLTISLSIFVLIVIGARRQARAITKPIVELTEATKAIAQGDYSLPLKVVSNDEIGVLADNFEKMRMTVKEYTGNLESEVEKRTTELRHAMDNLSTMKDHAETATRAKSEFLSNMSHEIRTPMNAVVGFGDLLKQTKLDNTQKDYVETICSSGELLLSLINDILDISKIESQKTALEEIDLDLKSLVNNIIKIVRQKAFDKKIGLHVVYPDAVPRYFKGDPTRIGQIFLNLLSNAIKFTNKGSVTVTVRELNALDAEKTALEMSVKDTGIGISRENHQVIFDSFAQVDASITRKYGGTGLGLTITRALVQMMGGTIRVESEEGKGSEFIVGVALKKAPPPHSESSPVIDTEVNKTYTKGASVLVVEDNPLNQKLMAILLKQLDCITDMAANGNEAVDMAGKKKYDVIFMDLQMPVMDGYMATGLIREQINHTTPIIALTAKVFQEDQEKCVACGMSDFLTKPVETRTLKEMILRWRGRQANV